MKVLIVEDTAADAAVLKDLVTEISNAEAVWCRTAEEASLLLGKMKFDLFLLDVQLPRRNGFSLAGELRKKVEYRLTPVLFVTGDSRGLLDGFRKYHCYDYITKPVCREELRTKIRTLAASIEHRRETEHAETAEELACISTREGDYFISKRNLLFVEIRRGVGRFYTTKGEIEKRGASLSGLLDDLSDPYIVRCHRSFAVNVRNIAEIIPVNYRLWKAAFDGSKETVDISEKYYAAVRDKIQALLSESAERGK